MQRRNFIKNTALSAIAVSAFGFIRFDGNHYTGDCETTTDILGPYYRPNSPLRNNLLIAGDKGTLVELSGIIKHNDCISPYANAKIELWHCDSKGVYDNSSDAFLYRGTSFSDEKGFYSFKTILPVSYNAGGGLVRPAHFHLMITAEGYQPLVTQLYFTGDKDLDKDPSSASPAAKRRTLDIQDGKDGTKKVIYNVGMTASLPVEVASLDRLTGVYTAADGPKTRLELFQKNKALWMKNEVFGEQYDYKGNNRFEYPGGPEGSYSTLQFELLPGGAVQVTLKEAYGPFVRPATVYVKDK